MEGTSKVYESVVIPDLSDTARKLKNNVVLFSVISIFMFFGDVSISESSSFLGFSFNGLTQDKIYVGMVLAITYSSIHYALLLNDSLSEWALRCSVVNCKNKINPSGDLSLSIVLQNEKYNNLYFWWQYHKHYYDNLSDNLADISKLIDEFKEKMDCDTDDCHKDGHIYFHRFSSDLYELREYLSSVAYVFQGNPIEKALKNFDARFRSFLLFQNIRWLIFEYIVPFSLASLSLYCLSVKISPYVLSHL